MPIENDHHPVSNHDVDSATPDTSNLHHEQPTPAIAPSQPLVTPHAQFEALTPHDVSRPPAQDTTGLRLNADSSKLDAFRQRRGSQPTAHPGDSLGDRTKTAQMTHDTMSNQMQEMMWFQQATSSMQIQEKMLVSALEFEKQLAGDMAKLSEPIR